MRVCKAKVEMYWEWKVAVNFGHDSFQSYLWREGLWSIFELISIEVDNASNKCSSHQRSPGVDRDFVQHGSCRAHRDFNVYYYFVFQSIGTLVQFCFMILLHGFRTLAWGYALVHCF